MSGGDKAQAKTHYNNAIGWFKTLTDNFTRMKKQAAVDRQEYKTYKDTFDEKVKEDYLPLQELARKNPVVRGHGDPDFAKWFEDAESKYKKLVALAADVQKKVK